MVDFVLQQSNITKSTILLESAFKTAISCVCMVILTFTHTKYEILWKIFSSKNNNKN